MDETQGVQPDAATAWSLSLWVVMCVVLVIDHVGWRRVVNHQGLAAWIQAIGSILAILAAIWIARRQYEQAERAQRFQAADAIGLRAAVVERMVEVVRMFLEPSSDRVAVFGLHRPELLESFQRVRRDEFSRLTQMLASFPVEQFRNADELLLRERVGATAKVVLEDMSEFMLGGDFRAGALQRLKVFAAGALERVSEWRRIEAAVRVGRG